MKLNEHIDTIRRLLKQTSDDSQYPPRFIARVLANGRAFLLERELSKNKILHEYNWQTVYMPMNLGVVMDDQCLQVGCKVRRSSFLLPEVLNQRHMALLKVSSIYGSPISKSSQYLEIIKQYTRTKQHKPGYDIVNKYLIVFNNLDWEVIQVRAVFANPFDLSEINTCGDEETCYDALTSEFPIDPKLHSELHEYAVKFISATFPLPEDIQNDAKSLSNVPNT